MLATSLFASAVQAGGSWTTFTHSCPGANRTDALHRDADGSLWVGCGTNASGYGLQPGDSIFADRFDQP